MKRKVFQVSFTDHAADQAIWAALEQEAERTGKSRSRIAKEALQVVYLDRSQSAVLVVDR